MGGLTIPAARPDREREDRFQANLNCRYYVRIDGGLYRAVFTEVSGLQLETDIVEIVEGGNNALVHRLPGLTRAGNVTLRRGITRGNELLRWYARVIQGDMDVRSVQISAYATDGRPLLGWSLRRAFPVRWTGPTLAATGRDVAIESLELAHSGEIDFDG